MTSSSYHLSPDHSKVAFPSPSTTITAKMLGSPYDIHCSLYWGLRPSCCGSSLQWVILSPSHKTGNVPTHCGWMMPSNQDLLHSYLPMGSHSHDEAVQFCCPRASLVWCLFFPLFWCEFFFIWLWNGKSYAWPCMYQYTEADASGKQQLKRMQTGSSSWSGSMQSGNSSWSGCNRGVAAQHRELSGTGLLT